MEGEGFPKKVLEQRIICRFLFLILFFQNCCQETQTWIVSLFSFPLKILCLWIAIGKTSIIGINNWPSASTQSISFLDSSGWLLKSWADLLWKNSLFCFLWLLLPSSSPNGLQLYRNNFMNPSSFGVLDLCVFLSIQTKLKQKSRLLTVCDQEPVYELRNLLI